MTSLIGNFVNRVDFKSYKDFYDNFEFNVPKDFNFGFDVVDEYARIDPEKLALIWCDDNEKNYPIRLQTSSNHKELTKGMQYCLP